MHSMGIVHRDISPDNLMFDSEGNLKLIDFGALRWIEDWSEEGHQVVVKEAYAPPEQYTGSQMTGPWSDIYAVCGVMYQALTGRKPVPSMERIRKDTLIPISGLVSVPEKVEAALMQGLSLDVQKRYFYAGNLMEKLGMEEKNVQVLLGKTRHVWGEIWLQIITEKNTDLQKNARKKWTRRQKKILVSAAVAVCFLAVCLGTGLYWYGETHPTEVFSYKAEKARVYAKKHPDQYLITEEDAGFSKILEALNEYENEQTWEDKDYHRYEVPTDILQKKGPMEIMYRFYWIFYTK